MYKHPEINYQPQHPMLNQQRQESEYTIEEEGVLDSIKSGLSAASSAIAKGARAAKEGLFSLAGKSTAPKEKQTKANAQKWYTYYTRARNIDKLPQKEQGKEERALKKLLEDLKKSTGGTISYDDSKKIGGYM